MRSFKKLLAGALAALMVTASAPAVYAAPERNADVPAKTAVVRLGGSTRFETANLIADEGWKSAETVFLANSGSYADALAGTPLAYAYSAPILLTDGKKLSDSVKAEIKKLGAKNVYLLGGEAAISGDVMNDLKKTYTVTRIWGQTRYETALKIAEALEAKGQAPADIFIASGVNYPDALSASSAAAIKHAPILYAPASGQLDKESADFIAKCKPYNVYILGGKAAVGEAAEDAAKKAGAQSVSRLGGADRYDTSVVISKQFDPQFKSDTVCFATGKNFPDALAGSVLAAKESAPVLLTDNSEVRKETREYVAGRERPKAYVFGGKAVISDINVNGYVGNVTDITDTVSAADKKAIEKAVELIAGTVFSENSSTSDLLYHTLLCPPWVAETGITQDYFPVQFSIVEYAKTPDPRKQFKNAQKYAKCNGNETDKLLELYFNLTAKHENSNPREIYYQGGYYYLPFGGYGDMIIPVIKLDSVYDIGDGCVYVKYSANGYSASVNGKTMYDCCTLRKKNASSGSIWSYVRNASSDYYYIAPAGEKPADDVDLSKYVGTYTCDRCSIEVKKTGGKNELSFDIWWSSSAFEHEEWSMSGVIDEAAGKVAYSNAKRTNHVFYDSTGKDNVKTVYTNGTGSFIFNNDGSLTWNNTDSDVSAKGMKFVKPSALPDIDMSKYVGSYSNDKCTVEVKKTENKNELGFAVSWNTKELTHEEWIMSGVMTDASGKVAYYNAERSNHVLLDAIGQDNVTPVYINGRGSFAFGSDGSLIWNNDNSGLDKDLPAKDMKLVKSSSLPDADLSGYVGRYGYSRCTIDVSESGEKNGLKFDIQWSNSAADYYTWTMTGVVDPTIASRVTFSDSVKTYHRFDESGKEVETKVVYKDGAGRFQFGDGYLLWQDEQESKENEDLAQTKFVRSAVAPTDAEKEAVKSAVSEMYKINYGKVVEEVKFNDVKVYTAEEIAAEPALKDYKLGDKDIVFEIAYELKIIEGYEDIMQFTAGTGDVKGDWVVDKYNVGIARYVSDGEYTVDSFGTSF